MPTSVRIVDTGAILIYMTGGPIHIQKGAIGTFEIFQGAVILPGKRPCLICVRALTRMSAETKTCTTCEETKPATTEFFFRNGPIRLRGECKCCIIKARRKGGRLHGTHSKRDADKKKTYMQDYEREVARFKTYGVTREAYHTVLAFQDERCALCRQPFEDMTCIDHCHTTLKVRGILCQTCNTTFERENYPASKQSTVPRYLSIPYVWDVALAVKNFG